MLPLDSFSQVVESTPLISIDLVVESENKKILLGKRNNRPAKGYWFVPGGRVYKNENLIDAFSRLLRDELGLSSETIKSDFLGVYQHFYNDSFVSEAISTHYIVLAYRISLPTILDDLPCEQHSEYRWFDKQHILLNDKVHKHSKWYFMAYTRADDLFCL